ncbi:MAG: cyanophycinase [Bacteroidetes bacterium]|nr:cyanophycinase [Bacteroidota bacterium]MBU1720252.1 cyanophycinase [Bacteroidota bacterium]
MDIFSVNRMPRRGFLVLIGGAEDKKDDKVVLRRVVNLNSAKSVAVIPTASEYPAGLADKYTIAFKEIGVEEVSILDIRRRDEADTPENFEKINKADMIFFTGGDQVKLVSTLSGTSLLSRMRERHNDGVTIAGTSAGAAAASNPLLFDGDYAGLVKGSVNFGKGFGFLEGVAIDTHFVHRGRIGRLAQFLCSGFGSKGIGIGEDTAIIISSDNIFEVVGKGIVTVVSTEDCSFNNFNAISDNQPIVLDGIRVGFMQTGALFDMNKWRVSDSGKVNHFSPLHAEVAAMVNV